jgi:hypothetical protein
MEGSGGGLVKILSRSGGTEENQSRYPVCWPRFEPVTSRIRSKSDNLASD